MFGGINMNSCNSSVDFCHTEKHERKGMRAKGSCSLSCSLQHQAARMATLVAAAQAEALLDRMAAGDVLAKKCDHQQTGQGSANSSMCTIPAGVRVLTGTVAVAQQHCVVRPAVYPGTSVPLNGWIHPCRWVERVGREGVAP
jgi:hypothetical protein